MYRLGVREYRGAAGAIDVLGKNKRVFLNVKTLWHSRTSSGKHFKMERAAEQNARRAKPFGPTPFGTRRPYGVVFNFDKRRT